MEFDSDFSFETNYGFSDSSQSTSHITVGENFTLSSEFYTPISERSVRNVHGIALDCADKSLGGSCAGDPSSSPGLMFTLTHKCESEMLTLSENDSVTDNDSLAPPHQDTFFEMHMAAKHSIGSVDSCSLTMHTISPEMITKQTSLIIIPTTSLSASEMAALFPPMSTLDESAICLPSENKFLHGRENLEELHSDVEICRMRAPFPPERLCSRLKITDGPQQYTELQQTRKQTRFKVSVKTKDVAAGVPFENKQKCDYRGCHKAFRRSKHLKRHKQSFHGEGPNRFSCEFCGRDQFNRKDNLNNHRKLHARSNNRYRGVEFIPAAVAVIEQEKHSRMRKAYRRRVFKQQVVSPMGCFSRR